MRTFLICWKRWRTLSRAARVDSAKIGDVVLNPRYPCEDSSSALNLFLVLWQMATSCWRSAMRCDCVFPAGKTRVACLRVSLERVCTLVQVLLRLNFLRFLTTWLKSFWLRGNTFVHAKPLGLFGYGKIFDIFPLPFCIQAPYTKGGKF